MPHDYIHSIEVTSEPAVEPVTLTDLANHVRNTAGHLESESSAIDIQLAAARQSVEQLTGRALITRTLRLNLEWLPIEILMPFAPLIAVSSFAYTDVDGASQTLTENTDFIVDTASEPGRIKAVRTTSWPALRTGIYNPAQITYTAGYGTAATDVPAKLRQAVLLLAGHWYYNREPIVIGVTASAIAMTFDMLIADYRIQQFGRMVA